MSNSPNTKTNARGRRGSLKDSITLNDVAEIVRESEKRMKAFIKDEIKILTDRLAQIETNVSLMKTECVRLDDEVSKIKKYCYQSAFADRN